MRHLWSLTRLAITPTAQLTTCQTPLVRDGEAIKVNRRDRRDDMTRIDVAPAPSC